MSAENLTQDVESIAMALSEDGGYEYYHIDDALKELAKGVTDVQTENAKLRKLCARMFKDFVSCDCELRARAGRTFMAFTRYALELRELGIEVDE